MIKKVLAFSGGKDSTALALALAEVGDDFSLLHTPTGNEFPEVQSHVQRIARMTQRKLVILQNESLEYWIHKERAIPNYRMRFCTRLLKIEPCIDYLKQFNGNVVLYVGFRADEDAREGLYGNYATYQYPMQHWGWGVKDVNDYLARKEIIVPPRTDCAWCYYQRLIEWWQLWKNHGTLYRKAEELERRLGHTFRAATKDKHPTSLRELREQFEKGWIPPHRKQARKACKVCTG